MDVWVGKAVLVMVASGVAVGSGANVEQARLRTNNDVIASHNLEWVVFILIPPEIFIFDTGFELLGNENILVLQVVVVLPFCRHNRLFFEHI